MEYQDFSNKKVIIAGSEGLLGQVISEKFQELNATVIGLDLKNGQNLLDESFVKSIMQEHLGTNVLINTFALNPQPDEASWDLFNVPLESIEKYLNVNLLALFSICREFARTCAEGASIINFSSTYGVNSPKHFIYPIGFVKHIGYTITKAGVLGLSKYLATYLAPRIRVNTIVPGGVLNNQSAEFIEAYSEMTPMHRMMKKEEILGAILYLSSELSSYTTGSTLTVDGGWTAW
jgi:NAD(P)-dependent dehydrogenase (short-subunit alcohol dehydrogenase family)